MQDSDEDEEDLEKQAAGQSEDTSSSLNSEERRSVSPDKVPSNNDVRPTGKVVIYKGVGWKRGRGYNGCKILFFE